MTKLCVHIIVLLKLLNSVSITCKRQYCQFGPPVHLPRTSSLLHWPLRKVCRICHYEYSHFVDHNSEVRQRKTTQKKHKINKPKQVHTKNGMKHYAREEKKTKFHLTWLRLMSWQSFNLHIYTFSDGSSVCRHRQMVRRTNAHTFLRTRCGGRGRAEQKIARVN